MKAKRFSTEQIVNKLRQADVLLLQGETVAQASRSLCITAQAYAPYRVRGIGLF